MKNILIFTNMSSVQKYWNDALNTHYNTLHFQDFKKLVEYIRTHPNYSILMLDEQSTQNISKALEELNNYKHIDILLFNAIPEVYHASTLLGKNVKGYENTFLAKVNLLKMLNSVENGKNWLFSDLTNFIISKFIQENSTTEPEFMQYLTQKEKDIAIMIANGLSNKEIANAEKIALSTVKGHISKIFEKANVSDRVSLALKFK